MDKKEIFVLNGNVIDVFHEEHEANGTIEYILKEMELHIETNGFKVASLFLGDREVGFVSLDENNCILCSAILPKDDKEHNLSEFVATARHCMLNHLIENTMRTMEEMKNERNTMEKKVIFVKDGKVIGTLHEELEANGTVEYTVGKIMISNSSAFEDIKTLRFAPFYLDDKREGFVSLSDDNKILDVVPMSILEMVEADTSSIRIVEEEL